MEGQPDPPEDFVTWLAAVDRIMKRDWCIDTDDAGIPREDALRYWREGESPEEFVAWFAEKYDLIRFEAWR